MSTYNIVSYELSVFNRWGEPIASFTQKEGFWDGTYKGRLVEPGIYPFRLRLIDIFGQKHYYNASVNIVQ